jgi:hypothetical protein
MRAVAFARSHRAAWVNLSLMRRVLGAITLVVPVGLLAIGIAALARGPWVQVGLGVATFGILVVLPHVLIPERMLRAGARVMTPTAASMKRGDSNMSWPG